jgi:hypothetical protein
MRYFTTKYFIFDACLIIYLFITELITKFIIYSYLGEDKLMQGFGEET